MVIEYVRMFSSGWHWCNSALDSGLCTKMLRLLCEFTQESVVAGAVDSDAIDDRFRLDSVLDLPGICVFLWPVRILLMF